MTTATKNDLFLAQTAVNLGSDSVKKLTIEHGTRDLLHRVYINGSIEKSDEQASGAMAATQNHDDEAGFLMSGEGQDAKEAVTALSLLMIVTLS